MGNKFKTLVIGAIIVGIISGGFYLFNLAEQKESRVNIVYNGMSRQEAAEAPRDGERKGTRNHQ